jgi:hypothetical protein
MGQAAAVVVTVTVALAASVAAAEAALQSLAVVELGVALPVIGRRILEMAVLAEVAEVALATSRPLLAVLVEAAGVRAVVAAAVLPAPAATAWSF